jgi:tRNA-2-methylthio-N6-dimethylallyladenosine synthase
MTAFVPKMRYWLENYGCQMNKAEAQVLEIILNKSGIEPAPDSIHADLVIINTCSVRKTAEDRIWGRLGYYCHLKREKDFILAVIGCMSERLKEELFEKNPGIDLILGTFQKQHFIDLLQKVLAGEKPQIQVANQDYEFARLHSKDQFKAFVPIMHGCNNYCSYCIVPFVRGREISRNPEEIMEELRVLEARGTKEVTLLGQNVNSYNASKGEKNCNFPALLELITREISEIRWFRFLTSHPKDVNAQLIQCLVSNEKICRHIHLPVQHGSNRILSLMNRGYTREDYLALVRMIKNTVSDVTITTDILIGFPTEDEADFMLTKELMEEVEFDDAFTYYYNPREGTAAFGLGDTVCREEKIRRLREIIETNQRLKQKRKLDRLGRTTPVLVEAVSKKNKKELLGRTEHDEMVVFEGEEKLIGNFINLRLMELSGTTFRSVL